MSLSPTPQRKTKIPFGKLLEPLKEPMRRHWSLAALTILAGWGKFVLPMALPLLTGHLIDDVVMRPAGPATNAEFVRLAWLFSGIIVFIWISTYYRHALAQQLASHLQHELRQRLFYHIQRLSMRFFNRHHAGSLGSRVSSDINHAGIVVDKGLIQLSMDGVSLIPLVVFMLHTNAILACVCFAFVGCNAWVLRRYSPDIRMGSKNIQEHQSSVTGRAAEYFSAITVVKAFAGEEESSRDFARYSEEVRILQVSNSKLQGYFQAWNHVIMVTCHFVVALAGAWLIIEQPGSLTKGNLVEILLFVGIINGTVQRLTDSMMQIQDGFAALERIHDILAVLPTPADAPNALSPTLTGEMRFEDVTFGYGDKPVIRDFSFEFKPGKTYALVGPSGSGKSTLTQLMLRFYDPEKGRILLDGHPLDRILQSHYRSQVATVLQDPIIFSTSVRDNIGFASHEPSQEDIEKAARAAQAHDFILTMPNGYDSRLGERGVALSGGQRQRIAIARALMRDPKILILDEATSALDTVTERSIQDVIEALQGTRTVVIIAHRLSTIRNVDEILVMADGQLAEHGDYQTLKDKGGLFAKLLEDQKMEKSVGC